MSTLNPVNCWEPLRVIGATAQMETSSANARKFNELGNQQPSTVINESVTVQRPFREEVGFKGIRSAGRCLICVFDRVVLFLDKNRGITMWSHNHEECTECGTTSRKHMAKGLCTRCYSSAYARKHPEKIRRQKRKWYEKQCPNSLKRRREEKHFDGKRQEVLKRDGYMCQKCGCSDLEQLVVHHRDGSGRGKTVHNNGLDNLITLCRSCHASEHNTLDRWSRNYDRCLLCGTTSRKHNARGYCTSCYHKVRF
jgi:5-methylcytosine-specific restriction endonuclease McrA